MFKRIIQGDFQPQELRVYLVGQALTFWGLIAVCWWIYPTENKYSIMTHTFSFLGSFATKHNPEGWWLFSIAMVFWGASTLPVILYIRRRFAHISSWAAWVGAGLMAFGSVNIIMVGLFPDAHGEVIAGIEWTDIHMKVAVFVAVGYILGNGWCGGMLVKDFFGHKALAQSPEGGHRKMLYPFLMLVAMLFVAGYFLISWEFVYADMKAMAQASGESIGSSFSEGKGTIYSFPLWENLCIYTLFVFLMWLALAVPHKVSTKRA